MIGEQRLQYYEALQENGVSSELLVIEGVSHGEDLFYRETVLEQVIAFLDKL